MVSTKLNQWQHCSQSKTKLDPEALRLVKEIYFHDNFQNLDTMQIEGIKEQYKPAYSTNVTETLMAIAEIYGDGTYKCPAQEVAQVFPFKHKSHKS